jgi:hypothetical protein
VSWAARLASAGLVLGVLVAAVAAVARGRDAVAASACGSLLGLVAQLGAVGLLRPVMGARTPAFMRRWAAGMAVRGASLVVLAGLVVLLRGAVPVLWMAVGYLGTLLPLLFLETRYLR